MSRSRSRSKSTSGCGHPSGVKGAKGMLVDTCCYEPTHNPELAQYDLCAILGSNQSQKISLYRYDKGKAAELQVLEVSDPSPILRMLKRKRNSLAVKYYYTGTEKEAFREMNNDMIGDASLYSIYTSHSDQKYLTLSTELKYKSFKYNGISVEYGGKMHYYYLSNRCVNTLDNLSGVTDRIFLKLTKQLLESFEILHSKEYYHGDVKLQNMMECPGKDIQYKLIDWGRLYPVKQFDPNYIYGGSKQSGSPLGFYFMFRNKTRQFLKVPMPYGQAANLSCKLFEGRIPLQPLKSPLLIEYGDLFRPMWEEIKQNFLSRIDQYKRENHTDETIFQRYRFTLDLYNLGLSLLYLVYKHGLSRDKYEPFIRRLVMYNKQMITTSSEALLVFKAMYLKRATSGSTKQVRH